jgi:hypothetical protein
MSIQRFASDLRESMLRIPSTPLIEEWQSTGGYWRSWGIQSTNVQFSTKVQ